MAEEKRFTIDFPGYVIRENTEDGGSKPFFSDRGVVYEDVPESIVQDIQGAYEAMRDALLAKGVAASTGKKKRS